LGIDSCLGFVRRTFIQRGLGVLPAFFFTLLQVSEVFVERIVDGVFLVDGRTLRLSVEFDDFLPLELQCFIDVLGAGRVSLALVLKIDRLSLPVEKANVMASR